MDSPQNQSAVWPAVKRGALLGVYVAIGLYVAITPFVYYLAWTSPSAREDIVGANRSTLSHVGEIVAGLCLTALFCAIAGAVIMGAIGLVRSRRRV